MFYETLTTTERNSYTSTYITTDYYTGYPLFHLFGCTYTSECYNSTNAISCTGSCTTAALLCTDQSFPYCASLYTIAPASTGYAIKKMGISYFCDTAAYGLQYGLIGNEPTTTSTYTTTSTNIAEPSSTPTVVPYSMTQASVPATAATPSAPAATSATATFRPNAVVILVLTSLSLLGLYFLR